MSRRALVDNIFSDGALKRIRLDMQLKIFLHRVQQDGGKNIVLSRIPSPSQSSLCDKQVEFSSQLLNPALHMATAYTLHHSRVQGL